MTENEERRSGSLLKVLVNAWKLFRSAAATARLHGSAEESAEVAGREVPSPLRNDPAEVRKARVRTGAWVVIGASLVWKGVRAAANTFLTKPAEPGSPAAAAGRQTEEEKVRKGKWLMLGALLTWKAGKSLAKSTAETFLEEPGEGVAVVEAPGGARDAAIQVRRESKAAELASEGERLVAGGAVVGWEALRVSAAAVGEAVKKTLAKAPPAEAPPSTGREEDRNLDREKDVNLDKRARWGTLLVTLASLAGMAGGIAFVVTFWTGGPNQWLGGGLAVFLGGFGATLVLWAHWLTMHKEAVEPRERVSSPVQEEYGAAREFRCGAQDIQRRQLLGWMAAGGAGIVGAIVISLIRSLGFPPSLALDTTVWKRGQRLMTVDGVPVKADSLQPGGMIIVFPENSVGSEKSQTVLVRVRQDWLHLPASRGNWAPMGNLAYSRICTHAGCSVGMYEANAHLLMCPCHQSTFDVLTGAQPTGGPAARPLPQLPLYVDSNGDLRAADGFSDYPGPGFWGMPS